jgi:hypothetical protein
MMPPLASLIKKWLKISGGLQSGEIKNKQELLDKCSIVICVNLCGVKRRNADPFNEILSHIAT